MIQIIELVRCGIELDDTNNRTSKMWNRMSWKVQ